MAVARDDLETLLRDAFTVEELRRLAGRLEGMPDLGAVLSSGSVDLESFAHEWVLAIERRNGLRSSSLWETLIDARPQRRAEIEQIAAGFGAGGRAYADFQLLGSADKGRALRVWRARDRISKQLRAIKVSHAQRNDLERVRLEREYRVLSGLRHPAILRVHHMVGGAGYAWMVADFLDGGSLQGRLGQTWSDLEIARLGARLADGLATLHDLNPPVVHRDIKPDNILFDAEGEACLIGLGHAAELVATGSTATRAPDSEYAAPEVSESDGPPVDGRADVFSLCAVLLRLAVGDQAVRFRKIRQSPAPALTGRDPVLIDALCRGLAEEPGERFADAGALRDALAELLRSAEQNAQRAREDADRRLREERETARAAALEAQAEAIESLQAREAALAEVVAVLTRAVEDERIREEALRAAIDATELARKLQESELQLVGDLAEAKLRLKWAEETITRMEADRASDRQIHEASICNLIGKCSASIEEERARSAEREEALKKRLRDEASLKDSAVRAETYRWLDAAVTRHDTWVKRLRVLFYILLFVLAALLVSGNTS